MKRNNKEHNDRICMVCKQEITENNTNACPTCEGDGCEICLYTGYCPGCRSDDIAQEVTMLNRKYGLT